MDEIIVRILGGKKRGHRKNLISPIFVPFPATINKSSNLLLLKLKTENDHLSSGKFIFDKMRCVVREGREKPSRASGQRGESIVLPGGERDREGEGSGNCHFVWGPWNTRCIPGYSPPRNSRSLSLFIPPGRPRTALPKNSTIPRSTLLLF